MHLKEQLGFSDSVLQGNVLQGDGSCVLETQKDIDYVPKKGERYETSRPQESDVWKVILSTTLRLLP